jgi:hypothetical protein
MICKRGKQGTYWMRFRFGGRFIHESTSTKSKSVAIATPEVPPAVNQIAHQVENEVKSSRPN